MSSSTKLALWLARRSQLPCHRQLLIISGPEKWTLETATSLFEKHTIGQQLWVGGGSTYADKIDVKDYRLKLGQEYDCVVLNCFKGFRANAAMALSGTIQRHGLMIMLCPSFDEWPEYPDPEQINRLSYGYHHQQLSSHFFKYLINCFNTNKNVAITTPNTFVGEPATISEQSNKFTFDDQNSCINKICKVATGHRNRPLIITADRGRGKSSALGIASAKLMRSRNITIWVTAHHAKAVKQVFTHCNSELPDSELHKHTLSYRDSTLSFKPVDKLLESNDPVDLILIDEAAALPIHQLLKIAKTFPRVVFSSTVHGYEGSGRGFEIKFRNQLTTIKPELRSTHLDAPIRWFQDDTLEQFWFNTMFHRAAVNMPESPCSKSLSNVSYEQFEQAKLTDDPEVLRCIFTLLQEAHYQTSPDDLQRLLDSPETILFGLFQEHTLIGVAHILEEGGAPLRTHSADIASFDKRIKGHMVAQNLASSYNLAKLSEEQQWRISRIAISTNFQGHGLGTGLLGYIEKQAVRSNVALLTTSFGCTSKLLKFWENSNFVPVKMGLTAEVSSGEHNCICIKPISADAKLSTQVIREEFIHDLIFNMDKELKNLSYAILLPLLLNHKITQHSFNQEIVDHFVLGKRPLSISKRHLHCFVMHRLVNLHSLESKEAKLITRVLLQNWSNENISKAMGLKGKKDIEIQIRLILKNISLEQ